MSDTDAPANEHEAVEALQRLGLTNYEAQVFLALQKLGTGTAREIHDVADVPRSQVYGAADALERRGLVEIQHATPKRYRPVGLEAARAHLTAELERERERAFGYLATVQREREGDETREDVWTIRGRGPIDDRATDLASRATDSLLFAADSTAFVSEALVETLAERARAGVSVTVVSENDEVRARFADCGVDLVPVAGGTTDFTGRVLLADDDVILLSVDGTERGLEQETAIWSAGTAMAGVLVRVTRGGIAALTEE
ncbi:MAG: TrmB family transcriptional regulator [Haloferacaceae archaeon]